MDSAILLSELSKRYADTSDPAAITFGTVLARNLQPFVARVRAIPDLKVPPAMIDADPVSSASRVIIRIGLP